MHFKFRKIAPIIDAMSIWAILAIILASVIAMEFVAWGSHKYIMHKWGWGWHRDHHEPHDNALEKNDLYGIVGAVMSMSMFAIGSPLVLGADAWEPGDLGWAWHHVLRHHLHADP